MKKQLAGFLAVMLAGAMCVGFAACGETEGENGENGENNENAQPVLTKDTDFEALVSDKLTAEQWDAAFTNEAFSGCTSELFSENGDISAMAVQFAFKQDGDTSTSLKIMSMAGDSQTMLYVYGKDSVKSYNKAKGIFAVEGWEPDVWYLETYDENDDEWEWVHSEETEEYMLTFRQGVAYDFAGQFDKFTYDETLHAYTYEGDTIEVEYTPMEMMGPYTVTKATLKFSGGKLAYAKVQTDNNDEEIFTYYDYGKTQISIPTEAQPMPE